MGGDFGLWNGRSRSFGKLWYISKENGNEINTIGEKWSEFQIQRFNNNSRPYYVLLNPNTEIELNIPVPYTSNIVEYLAWLNEGIPKVYVKIVNNIFRRRH